MTPTESSADASVTRSWSRRNSPSSARLPGLGVCHVWWRPRGPPPRRGRRETPAGAVRAQNSATAGSAPSQNMIRQASSGGARLKRHGIGEEDDGIADRPCALHGPDDSPALRRAERTPPRAPRPRPTRRQSQGPAACGRPAAARRTARSRPGSVNSAYEPIERSNTCTRPIASASAPASAPPTALVTHADGPEQPRLRGGERKRGRHGRQERSPGSSGCRRRAPSHRRSPRTRRDQAAKACNTSSGESSGGRATPGRPGQAEPPSGPPRDVPAVDMAFLFQAQPDAAASGCA